MSTIKVIEIMANSTKSWEDAVRHGVAEAAKSLDHIRSVYIQDQSAVVDKNKIVEFRTTLKLSFEVEHKSANGKK